jgi:hypothetical protein
MTLRPQPLPPVPEATVAAVQAAFPKGNLYVALRAEFGPLYTIGTELRPALPAQDTHAPMPGALAPGAFLVRTRFPVALCHGSLLRSQHSVVSITPVSCGLMATPIRGKRCPWPKSWNVPRSIHRAGVSTWCVARRKRRSSRKRPSMRRNMAFGT